MDLNFMAECSSSLDKLGDKRNYVWSDEPTTQDKPLSKHFWWHNCWLTSVVSVACPFIAGDS